MIRFRHFLFLAAILFFGCRSGGGEAKRGIIVSSQWLRNHLNDTSLVILHAGSAEVYDSIHIPGARYVEPTDFTRNVGSIRNQMESLQVIDSLLASVGVNSDSNIILYYENENLVARTARIFVTLDYAGLGDRTYVLNGGLTGWIEDGGETTDRIENFSLGRSVLKENGGVIVQARKLDEYRTIPEYLIFDARSREEYTGKYDTIEQQVEGGHIEGARLNPYQDLLSSSRPYMFLEDDQLRKIFEDLGMNKGNIAISYCNSGVRASVLYLVARHLGYEASLYDGSFEEWEMLDLPVTRKVFLPIEN